MNGENPEAQPPPPAKVEASPKAEAPRAEKGTETPGPLKPAEQKILGITGAPGTRREGNPRTILKLVAETPDPARDALEAAKKAALDARAAEIRAGPKPAAETPDPARDALEAAKKAAMDARAAEVRAGPPPAAETPDPALTESPEAKRAAIDRIAEQNRAEADARARQQQEADAQAKQKADLDAAKKAAMDARAAEVRAGPPPAAEQSTTDTPPAAGLGAEQQSPPTDNVNSNDRRQTFDPPSISENEIARVNQAQAEKRTAVESLQEEIALRREYQGPQEADKYLVDTRMGLTKDSPRAAAVELGQRAEAAEAAAEQATADTPPANETQQPTPQPEVPTPPADAEKPTNDTPTVTETSEQRVNKIPNNPDRILTPEEMSQYENQEKAKAEAALNERQEALLEHQREKDLAEQALKMKEISIRAAGREPTSRDYWEIADNDPAQPGLSAAAQEKARELVKQEQKDHETWFRENNEKRREEQDRQRAKHADVQQAVMRFAVNLGDKLNEQSGTTNPNTRPAETPPAGDAPPIKLASTRTTEEIKVINDRIKTGGASDETKSQPIETPSNQTAPATPEQPASDGETTLVEPQTQTPAAETPTEADVPSALAEQTFSAGTPAENPNPASPIPAEQATPADQTPVVGEVPSLPGAGQSPVEQLPTINPVEKPAEAGAQEMTAEQKQQAKQDLAARFTADGASETNKSKVLVEFDKDPAAVLSAEQTIRKIIKNPDVATAATPDEVKTEDNKTATPEGGQAPSEASQDQAKTEKAENPEQQEKTIEQKRKESLGEVVFKMSEYNIAPDKQANVLAMLSANPNMLMDTANVIKNLQIEKKEDIDPQTQMHEAIKKRIQELKNKIDPDNKSENNLTDDEKNQLKALNLLNDALTKEDPEDQDKLTKGTLILAILAAIIAGTLEGLKEGIEHSAKL